MHRATLPCSIVGLCLIAAAAIHAGPLMPPVGPVASSYKTLSEVEPRIAINATNTPGDPTSLFRISGSGSYYLTGNVFGVAARHGIKIDFSNVTIDLNGFALIGGAGSLDGINTPVSRENVVIRNGVVRAWGGSGINTIIQSGRIEGITAHDNEAWGISNSGGAVTSHIIGCEAIGNGAGVVGSGGIRAGSSGVISGCVARGNTGDGMTAGTGAHITDSVSSANAGNGFSTGPGGCVLFSRCTGSSNDLDGIFADGGSSILDCVAFSNDGDGIEADEGCTVRGNTCSFNGFAAADGAGIHITNTNSTVERNMVLSNDRGIDVDGTGNLIIANTATTNATAFDIVANNRYGPIVNISAAGAAAAVGSAAVSTLTTTDPWANLVY